MQHNNNIPAFVFFGGPQISVEFLDELEKSDLLPSLIVTTPDRPSGRKMKMSSPPLKAWADEKCIPVLQPEKFNTIKDELKNYDLFVVVAYGKIIPQFILNIPKYGSVNLHPSLLPKYRGASPIISAMLNDDKETGVSLMLLDELMDHGPILAQEHVSIKEWSTSRNMEEIFAKIGAELFLEVVPEYVNDKLQPVEQDHAYATECKKFNKSDMELDLSNPRESYLKYLSFEKPFFFHNETRIIVTDASYENDQFIINKVIPAGKKEISWKQYNS